MNWHISNKRYLQLGILQAAVLAQVDYQNLMQELLKELGLKPTNDSLYDMVGELAWKCQSATEVMKQVNMAKLDEILELLTKEGGVK